MRDRDILCAVLSLCLSPFFRLLYTFFFRVTQLIKAPNSKKSGAGHIRECSSTKSEKDNLDNIVLSIVWGPDKYSTSTSNGRLLDILLRD